MVFVCVCVGVGVGMAIGGMERPCIFFSSISGSGSFIFEISQALVHTYLCMALFSWWST